MAIIEDTRSDLLTGNAQALVDLLYPKWREIMDEGETVASIFATLAATCLMGECLRSGMSADEAKLHCAKFFSNETADLVNSVYAPDLSNKSKH
jgi:hypothetical protein